MWVFRENNGLVIVWSEVFLFVEVKNEFYMRLWKFINKSLVKKRGRDGEIVDSK